ncbi:hypothetical protein [Marinicellulosiphila megalodicopiae]|uniref:hypothetical protein n=1 Tax=Marinicellulosiphila megalodicopiae TaxID=2724896 RepID=UPI003BAF56BF
MSHSAFAFKLNAAEKLEKFSFFSAINVERIEYQELANVLPVQSKTVIYNPIMRNGGVHKLSDTQLLMIESISTIYPSRVDEQWRLSNNNLLFQENSMTYTLNTKRIYYYQQMLSRLKWVAGLEYSLHTFKRFDPTSQYIDFDWQLIEETKAEIILNSGFDFDSGRLTHNDWRYYGHLLFGIPAFTRAENTQYTDLFFDNARGYSIHSNFGISKKLTHKVHAGFLLEWDYLYRDAVELTVVEPFNDEFDITTVVEYPKHTTQIIRLGFNVHWAL